MKVGNREIGGKTFIIAEAGVYHGDHSWPWRHSNAEELCRKLAGWPGYTARLAPDAIKFQMFIPDEDLFCPLPDDDKRWWHWERSFMSLKEWRGVKEYAESLGMVFLASAFQPTAVEWLNELGVEAHKVASRAVKTYPYDDATGPFIISLGMHGRDDVPPTKEPLDAKFLQCDSQYPCKSRVWDSSYDGLSDHSGDVFVGVDAILRGCPMLEVHVDFHGQVRFMDQICARGDVHDHGHELNLDNMELLFRTRDESAYLRSH